MIRKCSITNHWSEGGNKYFHPARPVADYIVSRLAQFNRSALSHHEN